MLTTERIKGVKISEISPLTRIEHDFHPVADELTRAYLKQITIDGHFHADPHPGNVFVVLADAENPLTPSEAKAIDRRACRASRASRRSLGSKRRRSSKPLRSRPTSTSSCRSSTSA